MQALLAAQDSLQEEEVFEEVAGDVEFEGELFASMSRGRRRSRKKRNVVERGAWDL